MKMIKNVLLIMVAAILLFSCEKSEEDKELAITTVVDKSVISSTENSVFTNSGRLFVAGGDSVHEISKAADGSFLSTKIVTSAGSAWQFTGITAYGDILFAACTLYADMGNDLSIGVAASIYRIDTTQSENNVTFASLTPGKSYTNIILPNGMTVDSEGSVYFSNTYSLLGTLYGYPAETAIVKLKINFDGSSMTLDESAWLAADNAGSTPNGIEINGQTMYLASGNTLYEIPIATDGSAGTPVVLYTAGTDNILDDMAVLDGKIAVAELDDPFSVATVAEAKLVFISTNAKDKGTVTKEIDVITDYSIIPSDITFAKGSEFSKNALIITDYFNGGVYQVQNY